MDKRKTPQHYRAATGSAKMDVVPGNSMNYGSKPSTAPGTRPNMHGFLGKVNGGITSAPLTEGNMHGYRGDAKSPSKAPGTTTNNVKGTRPNMHPICGKKGC